MPTANAPEGEVVGRLVEADTSRWDERDVRQGVADKSEVTGTAQGRRENLHQLGARCIGSEDLGRSKGPRDHRDAKLGSGLNHGGNQCRGDEVAGPGTDCRPGVRGGQYRASAYACGRGRSGAVPLESIESSVRRQCELDHSNAVGDKHVGSGHQQA